MKNLKEYIVEGIFDIDDNIDNFDESIKDQIKRFLKDNFDGASFCKISDKPNADGKYEVSSTRNVIVENIKITSLTNGMFVWTTVGGKFDCYGCNSLKTLEGAPEKVVWYFSCSSCNSLTSLEGAPKEVGGGFSCYWCDSLTSLEGAPKKVGGDFDCEDCDSLTSLKGAPKEVGGEFKCSECKSLTSLEGAPKKVGRDFDCRGCGREFTIDDVKKVSNVKGNILAY